MNGSLELMMKQEKSCGIVIIHHMVDASTEKEWLQKLFDSGYICLHFSKMNRHIVNIVKIVKRPMESQERIECCCKPFLKLKYLIVGGLTVLVHFHLRTQLNTSWLRLTTSLNECITKLGMVDIYQPLACGGY
ncbi:hypothetical protein MTR_6g039810 [Medicago truncatula]|uniref:Uncharacterized protein n=1 Tax=Medicago truncatula TaxID=3880 RepID=A0A072U9E8_MEDTR|nr:hypothetical protein MTR_6g039810 [Medicago truncatula]